ncbi:MAG: hypothetical protein ACP59X_13160 [Solidesulfovibrio sp. DCME]|uniref:hypothetical protein n=1 Tax=Solidesulfovibrio sp. DCME TaxID=3447380 RepID=UPI003D09CC9E
MALAFVFVFNVGIFSAQAMTLPIRGAVKDSTETFTGTATVRINGEGDVKLATSKGVACMGNFSFESWSKGRGKVQCEDGRLGSFAFVTAGFSGSGAGTIADESFDFIIGK